MYLIKDELYHVKVLAKLYRFLCQKGGIRLRVDSGSDLAEKFRIRLDPDPCTLHNTAEILL
jgi:hypothetical protein